ncbi:MAG: hypothetical protein DMF31_00720 [Verrucomicrobia bacterium]|nr:MAG: hypothetical protein DMF31_00720 [Verrucomicrobiota bacterium]
MATRPSQRFGVPGDTIAPAGAGRDARAPRNSRLTQPPLQLKAGDCRQSPPPIQVFLHAPIRPKGPAIRIVFSSGGNRGRVAFFFSGASPLFLTVIGFFLYRRQNEVLSKDSPVFFVPDKP